MTIAFVIFVKTPGLSPVKTRLGKSIGVDAAEAFYEKSLEATAEVVQMVCKSCYEVTPYWAVAEREGLKDSRWDHFKKIFQGEGGLGERLHHVYESLQAKHSAVCFIGADSPHVLYQDYAEAIKSLNSSHDDFLLGNTQDGGFYFFAGKIPISKDAWTNVEYSTRNTSMQFSEELNKISSVRYIKSNFDIDELSDLENCRKIKLDAGTYLEKQKSLIEWISSLKSE